MTQHDLRQIITPRDLNAQRELRPAPPTRALGKLAQLLLGQGAESQELPPIAELVSAAIALATGKRRKALIPLTSSTGELALVRRGTDVLISYYDTGHVPQVLVRNRPIEVKTLLDACARTAERMAEDAVQSHEQTSGQRLASKARQVVIVPDPHAISSVQKQGGALEPPDESTPLSFGFRMTIMPGDTQMATGSARADTHALLFEGSLWAYVLGHKISLCDGSIFPVVQRMVSAVRGVVDAWEAQRGANIRLRAGGFAIGMRLDRKNALALTLSGVGRDAITLPPVPVTDATLPILRLASDLARAVTSADRSQARNLRLTEVREEVRALRKLIRARNESASFTNSDPERLRAAESERRAEKAPVTTERVDSRASAQPGRLRFALRWQAEIDGLDSASTFMCGDRLVVGTPRCVLALGRDNGEVLWIRETRPAASLMAGNVLLRLNGEGLVELCDVSDGEPYAECRITPRTGGPPLGLLAGGQSSPPVAILGADRDQLVAIDLRNGETRWRYRSRGRGAFKLRRAGRLLLVVSGDNTLDAVDVASGEPVWRWADPGKLVMPPAAAGDVVVAVSGQPGSSGASLMGFDLFGGQQIWRHELDAGPSAGPIATDRIAVVPITGQGRGRLVAVNPVDGTPRWSAIDPGMNEGGACLSVDDRLVFNAPSGQICGIASDTGEVVWQHALADPVRDDVPRRLEPILRGGALFVPSAHTHVLRPADGMRSSGPVGGELVPDFLRVDERGWLYVAEESGLIEAHAPVPNLRLVRGGG